MTPLRCLIVDDESPARDELRYLLGQIEGIEVVGAAATADEAEVLIASLDYDVVFLDIQMPGRTGLELAEQTMQRSDHPQIIFTTAYPDYAVDAFALSAADYLLKPISVERLTESIARVRQSASEAGGAPAPEPAPVVTAPARPGSDRLAVQQGDRITLIDPGQIVAASAARGYSYLLLANEQVLTSYSLAELEERLPPAFFRVHRSHLVNLDHVVELRPDFKGGLVVIIDDRRGTRIPVARRQAPQLRQRLGLSRSE